MLVVFRNLPRNSYKIQENKILQRNIGFKHKYFRVITAQNFIIFIQFRLSLFTLSGTLQANGLTNIDSKKVHFFRIPFNGYMLWFYPFQWRYSMPFRATYWLDLPPRTVKKRGTLFREKATSRLWEKNFHIKMNISSIGLNIKALFVSATFLIYLLRNFAHFFPTVRT